MFLFSHIGILIEPLWDFGQQPRLKVLKPLEPENLIASLDDLASSK